MSWLFSQALVEAFSEATCSGGAPCAQLNVMPTAQPFWRNDKPMDVSRFSRFGLTCAPLTADRGEALLTWYRADFLARTSPAPGLEPASPAQSQACGGTCSGWFGRYDPDSCSWRTPQRSSIADEGSEPYLETWPRAGLVCNGHAFQEPSLDRLKGGTGSGLLPTHVASDAKRAANGTSRNRRICDGLTLTDWLRLNFGQQRLKPSFTEWMMQWPSGWTDLGPLAMDKFQAWLQEHGSFSMDKSPLPGNTEHG